jgi:hypothetical protein
MSEEKILRFHDPSNPFGEQAKQAADENPTVAELSRQIHAVLSKWPTDIPVQSRATFAFLLNYFHFTSRCAVEDIDRITAWAVLVRTLQINMRLKQIADINKVDPANIQPRLTRLKKMTLKQVSDLILSAQTSSLSEKPSYYAALVALVDEFKVEEPLGVDSDKGEDSDNGEGND